MDEAHKVTDDELEALERDIKSVYKDAQKEISEVTDEYFKEYKKEDEEQQKKVESGLLTATAYIAWRTAKLKKGKKYETLRNSLANQMLKARQTVQALIHGKSYEVFALNATYQAMMIESDIGYDIGLELYTKSSVIEFLKDNPNLLPFKEVDGKKLVRWNKDLVARAITQGITQGESIPKIQKRLMQTISEMNANSALTNARTAVTSAENSGRDLQLQKAQEMGVNVTRIWIAKHDGRTRVSHIILDGQERKVGEPFEVYGMKIMKPGDINAPGELVYNCRCALGYRVDGILGTFEYEKYNSAKYKEWKAGALERHTNILSKATSKK